MDPLERMAEFVIPKSELVHLPVTSIVVETRQEMIPRIHKITEWHRRFFKFHREIVISDKDPGIPGTIFISCGTPFVANLSLWYSDMCVRHLLRLCDAPFILLWQWDGFVVNPHLWTDEFLNYDYVGAPLMADYWQRGLRWLRSNKRGWTSSLREGAPIVGSGGFSLRSRRFLEAGAAMASSFGVLDGEPEGYSLNEDFYLCVKKRSEMENAGIRYCPAALASRFSKDEGDSKPLRECFGFHDGEHLGEVKNFLESSYIEAEKKVEVRNLGEDRTLVVVCYPSNGLVSDSWKGHHRKIASLLVEASTEEEVSAELGKAKAEGFKWGVVLRPEEWLFVNQKKDSIMLSDSSPQALFLKTDSDSLEKVMLRLDRFSAYRRGQFIPEGMNGAERWTSMEDVVSTGHTEDLRVMSSSSSRVSLDFPEVRRMAVVVNHYRMPEKRLADHFEWNHEAYSAPGTRVFVVTDREQDVPSYACCLVYPGLMPVFNISAASNYGIRFAIDCGYRAVLKTDVDIVLGKSAWEKMTEVQDGRCISPAYYMALDYETRKSKFFRNTVVCGVCCMTARDWEKAHFHEGCWGYGHDDSVMLSAVERAGIKVDTIGGNVIWHMSHEGKGLKECERDDFWNRSGFNPHNQGNDRFLNNPVYTSPRWGLFGGDKKTYILDARKDFPEVVNKFVGLNIDRIKGRRVIAVVPAEFAMGLLMGIRCQVCSGRFNMPVGDETVLIQPNEFLG